MILLTAVLLAAPLAGPHPVGFETFRLTDAARPLEGKPRPIQVSLWYPAKAAGPALVYRDYLALAASERGPATPAQIAAAIDEHAAFLRSAAALEPAEIERYLAWPMKASSGAAPLPGAVPLVLVAQGNGGAAADQADLCELLASHGFVVATSPSPTRLTGQMKSESEITRVAEDQEADLAAVARAVRARRSIARGRPALVAHSFGARGALLYAMREGGAALVRLDGGIGVKTGRAELAASRFFSAKRARLPILHVYEDLDAFMARDFGLLESLTRADRWLVQAAHLHHVHFTFVGEAVGAFPGLAKATGADRETQAAHEAVLQAAVAFLRAAGGEARGLGRRAAGGGSGDDGDAEAGRGVVPARK